MYSKFSLSRPGFGGASIEGRRTSIDGTWAVLLLRDCQPAAWIPLGGPLGHLSHLTRIGHDKRRSRNVWSAAELQAKNARWQMVCANVFGLVWSHRLRTLMDVRSLPSYKLDGLAWTFSEIRFRERGRDPWPSVFSASRPDKNGFALRARVVLGGFGKNGRAIGFVLAQDGPGDSNQFIG